MDPHGVTAYSEFVSSRIIEENDLGIEEILDIKSIATLLYDPDALEKVVEVIIQNKPLPPEATQTKKFRAYLDLITIEDKRGRKFYVFVYDSDELWQDPTLLRIVGAVSI